MKKLYCLYDRVAQTSNEPMLISNDESAKRLFKNTCRRELAANPFAPVGDMELHYLADLDDDKGNIFFDNNERFIVITGDDFLKEENQPHIVGYDTPKKSVKSEVVNDVEAQKMREEMIVDSEEDM